jgi:hypothetical protein
LQPLDLKTGRFHPATTLLLLHPLSPAPYRASGLVLWHITALDKCGGMSAVGETGHAAHEGVVRVMTHLRHEQHYNFATQQSPAAGCATISVQSMGGTEQ